MRLENIFLIFVTIQYVHSAKILGVFPMPAISHYILASKLMKGLAEAGHDVTMISPYKLKDRPDNGKYTDVILDGFAEDYQALLKNFNLFVLESQSTVEKIKSMTTQFLKFTNMTFYHPNVKKLLDSNEKYDAVIMEQFVNDGQKVFAYIYDCPLIILSPGGPGAWTNPLVGNPQPIAYVRHMLNGDYSNDFTFLYRAKNSLIYLLEWLMSHYYMLPMHDEIMHKAFPEAPPLYDLYTNVSLILFNSHVSLYPAVPMVPNMIEIGGYFIDPPKKLPKDLQDFLDSAKEGVIYFSMGSNLKSKDIPKNKKKVVLGVLGKLKQKVLWKFEDDLPEKPSNVMIRKWFPQQDILAHPNIKLFITHGGLLSTTETISHGVPVLALPVFGDQLANAEQAAADGYGLILNYHDPDFTEKRFGFLVNEILFNSKYRENVQKRSKVYHDRPQKPMETAVYWVEYIIRHRGAMHLRVAGVKMPWYKYFMIDVISSLILGVIIGLYSVKLALKKLFCKNNKPNRNIKKTKAN